MGRHLRTGHLGTGHLGTGLAAVAVLALAGCSLLDPQGLDEPTLTAAAANQAAAHLATALDDLGARFLVGDPATEHLQVLRWEDDPDAAAARLAEQLTLAAPVAAFLRASATEIARRAEETRAVAVETRVTEAQPLGADDDGVEWVRVEIAQDETLADGHVTSSATSYGLGVDGGTVVEVRDLGSAPPAPPEASAATLVRRFAVAVRAGDEQVVERHLGKEVSDTELAALRAWLVAAGAFEVVELPAARTGAQRVAYLLPERGPLLRFDVVGGSGRGEGARIGWELVRG